MTFSRVLCWKQVCRFLQPLGPVCPIASQRQAGVVARLPGAQSRFCTYSLCGRFSKDSGGISRCFPLLFTDRPSRHGQGSLGRWSGVFLAGPARSRHTMLTEKVARRREREQSPSLVVRFLGHSGRGGACSLVPCPGAKAVRLRGAVSDIVVRSLALGLPEPDLQGYKRSHGHMKEELPEVA